MTKLYAKPFYVSNENDVGDDLDEYFVEWWAVYDANHERLLKAETEEIAVWVANKMNEKTPDNPGRYRDLIALENTATLVSLVMALTGGSANPNVVSAKIERMRDE